VNRAAAARRALLATLAVALAWSGLIRFPSLHDNDFPLLMWLVTHASLRDPSPLAIGHYPPVQLVLVRLLAPIAGSALVAAKALNIAATVGCAWLVAHIAERLSGSAWAGVLALFAFATTAQAMLTASPSSAIRSRWSPGWAAFRCSCMPGRAPPCSAVASWSGSRERSGCTSRPSASRPRSRPSRCTLH